MRVGGGRAGQGGRQGARGRRHAGAGAREGDERSLCVKRGRFPPLPRRAHKDPLELFLSPDRVAPAGDNQKERSHKGVNHSRAAVGGARVGARASRRMGGSAAGGTSSVLTARVARRIRVSSGGEEGERGPPGRGSSPHRLYWRLACCSVFVRRCEKETR